LLRLRGAAAAGGGRLQHVCRLAWTAAAAARLCGASIAGVIPIVISTTSTTSSGQHSGNTRASFLV
jgi:hypothetical protein